MLALVESFTATYDSEAVQARSEINQVSQSLGETRVLTNCLEQKLHYIERELNWLASAMPRQAKKGNGLATLTEKSSEYQSSASASQETLQMQVEEHFTQQFDMVNRRLKEVERALGSRKLDAKLMSEKVQRDLDQWTDTIELQI